MIFPLVFDSHITCVFLLILVKVIIFHDLLYSYTLIFCIFSKVYFPSLLSYCFWSVTSNVIHFYGLYCCLFSCWLFDTYKSLYVTCQQALKHNKKKCANEPSPHLRTRTLQIPLDHSLYFITVVLLLPQESEICVYNSLDL